MTGDCFGFLLAFSPVLGSVVGSLMDVDLKYMSEASVCSS
jgi:hypothetical protein